MAIHITNGGKIISFGSSKPEKQPKPTPVTAPVPEKILEDTAATDCVEDTAFPSIDDINAILNAERSSSQKADKAKKEAVIVYKLICSVCGQKNKKDSYTESYKCPVCGNTMNLSKFHVDFTPHSPQEIKDALYNLYVLCKKDKKKAQKIWKMISVHYEHDSAFANYKQEVINKYKAMRTRICYKIKKGKEKGKRNSWTRATIVTLSGCVTKSMAMKQLQSQHPDYKIRICSMQELSTERHAESRINENIQDKFFRISEDGKTVLGVKNKNLTTYTIPVGITSIGDKTFYWCENLTSIIIPKGVTSIGKNAFSNCKKLTEIIIPDGVTSIGEKAFFCCKNLTSITIPDSVTCIGKSAFSWCEKLTKIIIPDDVTHIGSGAFSNCKNLTEIIIPDGVTSISEKTFSFCEKLAKIIIPGGVTHIGDDAFSWCENLTRITIPKGVTHIGRNVFSFCENLTEIIIPDGVTSIGDGAFNCCKKLAEITIPKHVVSIGNCSFNCCKKLAEITIPKSVTKIGDCAFFRCENLTVTIYERTYYRLGKHKFEGVKKVIFTKVRVRKDSWRSR